MNVTVLTPGREVYAGSIKSIKVPGINGQFEVLKNHAPIVSALRNGEIRILDEKGTKKVFSIEKGFIEVLNNEVSVLVQGVQDA